MSAIEQDEHGKPRHWTIRVGTVDGYRRVKDNEPKFHEDVEVEVVAAELLQEAVEAGEALAQALERHPMVDTRSGPSGAALARWRRFAFDERRVS